MSDSESKRREGSLEAPTRHPIDWRSDEFNDPKALQAEMERVFDICHGCRRCFNLCHAFPTLFDAVDESPSGELDGVPREAYWEVVDHCYLCDMCYMSKCPYVPPHEWNVDFPHLMLRAKSQRFRSAGASARDRILSATDRVGTLAGIPVVAQTVNALNRSPPARALLEKTLGVHRAAPVPEYYTRGRGKKLKSRAHPVSTPVPTDTTRGQIMVFGTCYGRHNKPGLAEDLVAVFEHNAIPVNFLENERCCGMPKLELGDLESVATLMAHNIPLLADAVARGFDLVAPVPSCVLMFKQELPLMFPDDERVAAVRDAIFDPFEYLMLRHRGGRLRTDFRAGLGAVAWHVPCHLRVQNIGHKTREVLDLIPDTQVTAVERCSGHDGTYAVKKEYHDIARKIAAPVVRKVQAAKPDRFASDCPMAGAQIERDLDNGLRAEHPMRLLRQAYGLGPGVDE